MPLPVPTSTKSSPPVNTALAYKLNKERLERFAVASWKINAPGIDAPALIEFLLSSKNRCASSRVPRSMIIPAVVELTPAPVSPLLIVIVLSKTTRSSVSTVVLLPAVNAPAMSTFPLIVTEPVNPGLRTISPPSLICMVNFSTPSLLT